SMVVANERQTHESATVELPSPGGVDGAWHPYPSPAPAAILTPSSMTNGGGPAAGTGSRPPPVLPDFQPPRPLSVREWGPDHAPGCSVLGASRDSLPICLALELGHV